MTKHDDRKRLVRARMAKTGESYTTARARLSQPAHGGEPESTAPSAARAGMTLALSTAIAHAKKAAAEGGAQQVAPIHLCAGLVLTPGSIAHAALVETGVTPEDCLRRSIVDPAAARAADDVGVSVTARAVLEYAREALSDDWDADLAVVASGAGLVRVVRDGRLAWIPRPPLRTGHLLLGLLREGSAVALLPRLAAPPLRERVLELLATDAELPAAWLSQPRFEALPRRVRELLSAIGGPEIEEPEPGAAGHAVYQRLADLLGALPAYRQAQPPIALWHAALDGVRSDVDKMTSAELGALTRHAVEEMLAAAIDESPTVIRARRWIASSGATR